MMISVTKDTEGLYVLSGLSANDLEIIQEGIIRLFDESRRDEHRPFRRQVLQLNQPIELELDRLFNHQLLQRSIKFGK